MNVGFQRYSLTLLLRLIKVHLLLDLEPLEGRYEVEIIKQKVIQVVED